MSQQPIGIFDSGVGGLSILKAIRNDLPQENLMYYADSEYAPYGTLDEKILKQRCLYIADFFIKRNAKAMVIACNTATALMAEWLREKYDLPIIAIEPAIKPAASLTKTKRIGVFATQHTLKSSRYLKLKQEYAAEIEVFESPCLGFVEQVEKGELDSLKTLALIKSNLSPMLEKNIDTLILGCTHYPFLSESIITVSAGHPLTLINNAKAISQQLERILKAHNINNQYEPNKPLFFSSKKTQLAKIFKDILT